MNVSNLILCIAKSIDEQNWCCLLQKILSSASANACCSQNLSLKTETGIFPSSGAVITFPWLIIFGILDARAVLFDGDLCVFKGFSTEAYSTLVSFL